MVQLCYIGMEFDRCQFQFLMTHDSFNGEKLIKKKPFQVLYTVKHRSRSKSYICSIVIVDDSVSGVEMVDVFGMVADSLAVIDGILRVVFHLFVRTQSSYHPFWEGMGDEICRQMAFCFTSVAVVNGDWK